MGLYDESGNLKVSYVYEGYGAGYYVNNTSDMEATLAVVNPLAYRGYVLDMGTNLYYLQSRYYDPTLGRFINADTFASTGQGVIGNNMFAYCLNNPVNSNDPNGMFTFSISIGADVSVFFFGAAISIGIAFDDDGHVAVQWSYSLPNYIDDRTYYMGVLDAAVGGTIQITGDDTIYDLEGPSCYAGLSVGSSYYGSVDMVYSGTKVTDDNLDQTLPNGIQLGFGYGFGVDVHFRQTNTKTLLEIN